MMKLIYIGNDCVSFDHGSSYEVIGVDYRFESIPFLNVIDEQHESILVPATDFDGYENALRKYKQ